MTSLRRGIDPELLLSQVKNTMPYLFTGTGETALERGFPAKVVRELTSLQPLQPLRQPLSHFEYFRLCLSAHFLTCGTPVPTDVDNQIRHKLWPAQLPLEDALQMAELVIDCHAWDFSLLSNRSSDGLSGHLGEWFTVATAAYCALSRYQDSRAQSTQRILFEQIEAEVNHHSEVFASLWKARAGISCLKAAASIAHNFGDLDRVMDMWELSVGDPLRLRFHKLTTTPFDTDRKLRYLGRLWVAGELYKSPIEGSSLALENHRHFALRKPRCLRQSAAFQIPLGPFFDDWGRAVARGLSRADDTPTEDLIEVVEALKHGRVRLPKTWGYGRALKGISEVLPQFSQSAVGAPSQEVFEKKWSDEALNLMDEIPSRA